MSSPVAFARFQSAASPMAQAGCADDGSGTWTWRSSFRGSAERKAMSSLDRLPHAAHARRSASELQAERIIHSGGKLGVPERLVPIDVVEEVVEPAAGNGGEARSESPGQRKAEPRRDGEEALPRQIAPAREGARKVEERDARSAGGGEPVGQVEVAEQRYAARHLAEADRYGIHVRQLQRGRPAADREIDAPGELVAEIVARRQLDSSQPRRREEPVARRGVEKDLVAARRQQGPARAARALLRIVLEPLAGEAPVRDLHHLGADLHLPDEERVLEPLLDDVIARGERELPRRAGRLRHLRHRLAGAVEDDIDALVRRAEEEPSARRIELRQDHIARAAEIVQVDGMLGAGAGLRGRTDGAAVRVGVRLGQSDFAVAARVGVAEETGGEIVGEEARRDVVGLLRLLVRGGGGDEDEAARAGFLRVRDVEGGRGARALGAGDGARLAGIEEADADVGRGILERGAKVGKRQPRVAQAKLAVLRVPRVIDDEERLVAAVAGGARARGKLVEPAQHFAGVRVREEPRVLVAHAAQPGEDAVDASSVALRVAQGTRSGAAVRIADDEREAAHVRMGGGGHREDEERRGDAIHRSILSIDRTSTSDPFGAPSGPRSATSRRIASASRGMSESTVTRL